MQHHVTYSGVLSSAVVCIIQFTNDGNYIEEPGSRLVRLGAVPPDAVKRELY